MSIGCHDVGEAGLKQVLCKALWAASELAQEGGTRDLQETPALDELGQPFWLPSELRIALGMAEDGRDAAHGEVADQAFDLGQALRRKLKQEVPPDLGKSERAAVLQRLQEVRTEPDVAAGQDVKRNVVYAARFCKQPDAAAHVLCGDVESGHAHMRGRDNGAHALLGVEFAHVQRFRERGRAVVQARKQMRVDVNE
jgi:hypothetical protein